ncbi:hypothetical protein ACFX12_003828 [Malus domestica]
MRRSSLDLFPTSSLLSLLSRHSRFLLFSTLACCLQNTDFLALQCSIFLSGIIDNGANRSDSIFYPEKLAFPGSNPPLVLLHPNQQSHLRFIRFIPMETPRIEAQHQYCNNYKKKLQTCKGCVCAGTTFSTFCLHWDDCVLKLLRVTPVLNNYRSSKGQLITIFHQI